MQAESIVLPWICSHLQESRSQALLLRLPPVLHCSVRLQPAFQKFLQDHDIQLVTVNPFTVNRSMELDDNSPEKSDLKDPFKVFFHPPR